MTPSESGASELSPSPQFSVAAGWLLGLTCLTGAVVTRQVWRAATVISVSPPSSARFVVDVNRAGMDELQALPEVGVGLATKIIEYRQQRGGFHALDDLLDVPGVGPRTLEQLRPMLTIEMQSADQPESQLENRDSVHRGP